MHSHHASGLVGNQAQSVLHGMEARLTAIGDNVFHMEVVLPAQLMPIRLLVVWQHKDNAQLLAVVAKALQGVHEHRAPANWQELLRQVASHA